MSYAAGAVLSSRLLFPPPAEDTAGPGTTPQNRKGPRLASPNVLAGVVPASRLGRRPAPPTASLGISPLDELTGGFPRGALAELCGPASSGRTSVLLAAMAQCTRCRQEACALVDAGDSFDPASAAAAGVDLRRLLWVRCGNQWSLGIGQGSKSGRNPSHRPKNYQLPITNYQSRGGFAALEQALRATDLLLQGGGFGLVAVDLGDVPPQAARRIPLASWFRFRRAVENTPTVLLVLEEEPWAKSCASLVLRLSAVGPRLSQSRAGEIHTTEVQSAPSHARLFQGLCLQAEVLRARGAPERKPPQAAVREFESSSAWRIA